MRRSTARFFFAYLFFAGTIIATIGWLAEWKHLEQIYSVFQYSTLIAAIGHAAQVAGAFGSLLTPDDDRAGE